MAEGGNEGSSSSSGLLGVQYRLQEYVEMRRRCGRKEARKPVLEECRATSDGTGGLMTLQQGPGEREGTSREVYQTLLCAVQRGMWGV